MEIPNRPGWEFAGWYIDEACTKRLNPGGKIPEALQLYPKWIPIVYPVIYDLNGGVNSPYNPQSVSALSGILKLYPASCEGRQFAGWYWKGKRIEYLPEDIEEPVHLQAHFRQPAIVHFHTGAGSRISPVSVQSDGRLETMPVPVRIGYTFTGWYADAACRQRIETDHVFEEDSLLYAGWQLTQFPIEFDLDGGELPEIPPAMYTVASPTLVLPVPHKEGYRFLGWQSGRTMPVLVLRKGTIGPQHFKAVWQKENWQVFSCAH